MTRAADKNAAAYAESAPPPQQVVYAEPAVPARDEDVITQLERLGALKAQGLLTEEEFVTQTAKLLGPSPTLLLRPVIKSTASSGWSAGGERSRRLASAARSKATGRTQWPPGASGKRFSRSLVNIK